MKLGDLLLCEDGTWAAVEDMLDTGEWETVYNLRIANFHTYFVGCDEWGFSVWAHNAACSPDDIRRIARDAAEGDIDYVVKMINGEVPASRQGIHDYLEYMGARPNDIHTLMDQHGWHRATTWQDHVGEGKLTPAEAARTQAIVDEFQTSVYVGGTRAAGEGREVFSTLPVGKGRGTRSDIDFRFDVLHPRADEIKAALNGVGTPGPNGKFPGNAQNKYNINDPDNPLRWPYLDFHPSGE